MARRPQDRRGSRERYLAWQYKEAANYRMALSDGAVVQIRVDMGTAQVVLHFTRVDSTPTSERLKVSEEGERTFRVLAPQEFEQQERKILECSVTLRPDHAMQLAAAILSNLAKMPLSLRTVYSIPEIEESGT